MDLWLHNEIHSKLYRFSDFNAVVKILNPELNKDVFQRRICNRMLRYIGYDNWPEPGRSTFSKEDMLEENELRYGNIYHSINFNGATYQLEERKGLIGCVYFEVIDK